MTKRLREAILDVIEWETSQPGIVGCVAELKEAFESEESERTATMDRVQFLQDRLEEGMSKRDAARSLCEHDPRIGRRTAETLVYSNFSGMYKISRRGRKPKPDINSPPSEHVIPSDDPPPVSNDEALL